MCKAPKAPDYRPLAEAQRYAADLQYKASQEAIAEWKSHIAQTRKDFAPYRQAGEGAMAAIRAGWGETRARPTAPKNNYTKHTPVSYTHLTLPTKA